MSILGLLDGQVDEITHDDVKDKINACATSDPCEAAWNMAYAWNAQKAYELAIYQACVQIAIAGLQVAAADYAADKQYDIANRQMNIAEDEYDRYKARFLCNEHELADEVCEYEMYVPDYDTHADRAQRDVLKINSEMRKRIQRTRSRYCKADFLRDECNLAKHEATLLAQARDNAYRYEELRRDYFDNLRWERKRSIAQLGRSIMTGQSDMYAGAMALAAGSFQMRANAIIDGLSTVGNALGNIGVASANMQMQRGSYHNQSAYTANLPNYQPLASPYPTQIASPSGMTGTSHLANQYDNYGATNQGLTN